MEEITIQDTSNYVLTCDASGTPSWHPGISPVPSETTWSANYTFNADVLFPADSSWRVITPPMKEPEGFDTWTPAEQLAYKRGYQAGIADRGII
jgi:hypothetical protein